MINNFCPPDMAKNDITLKFAWKFMKKVFNDYLELKKQVIDMEL